MPIGSYLENTRIFRRPGGDRVKVADIDLGENPQQWFAKIYGAFEAQHPEVYENQDSVPSLTFEKKDFVSGDALGSMTVAAGSNMLVFPVIIRDGSLAPFDMMYVNGKLQYADKDAVGTLVNPYRPFRGVSDYKQTTGPGILNDMDWYKHKTTISSDKYASIDIEQDLINMIYPDMDPIESYHFNTSKIAETIKDEQLGKLASEIRENPEYFAHSTPEFKDYVSNIKNKITKTASENDWADAVSIERSDIDEYIVKHAKIGYDGYVEEVVDTQGVCKIASRFDKNADEVLDKVDEMAKTGGAVVIHSIGDLVRSVKATVNGLSKMAEMGLKTDAETTFKTPGQIGRYGTYNVLMSDGNYDTGPAYPMVDWNFNKSGYYLFVGNEYAIQTRMAGEPSSAPCRAARGEPREGATGTYVYEKAGTAFAIPPFKINSHRHTPSGIAITGRSLIEEKLVNLVPTDDVTSLVKITRENDPGSYMEGAVNVYVPSKMEFVVLPPERGLVIEDPQRAGKMASLVTSPLARGQHRIRFMDSGYGYYNMDMTGFPLNKMPEKIASLPSFRKLDRRADSLPEIYFNLKIAGASSPDVITNATPGQWGAIGLPAPKIDKSFCKEARLSRNLTAWEAVKNILPKDGIFKIAAAVESTDTLDELFALNFMNEDNVEYFMSNMGGLDEMDGFLTRLLLAARVSGIHNLSEDEIKNTLKGIVDVKKALGSFARSA